MSFFDKYNALCRSKGKTANSVAKELGLSSGSCTVWKKNKSTPRPETLKLIADYFNISVNDLLYDEKNPAPERDEVLRDVIDKISGLPPSDVQRVAEYVAFLESRGGK